MFHVKQKRVAFRCPAGACLLCRRLTLPLVCFFTPIPPTRARRALFPAGRGRFFVLFCRGLAPPAPLRLSPDGIGFFCRISAFLPPSPRPPSRREGGIFVLFCRGRQPPAPLRLSPRGTGSVGAGAPGTPATEPRGAGLPGGSAPCIPGAEPGRH